MTEKKEKPIPEDFGYFSAITFDDESEWLIEDGEEKYYEALEEWEKNNKTNSKL